jgi:hypothetical protein
MNRIKHLSIAFGLALSISFVPVRGEDAGAVKEVLRLKNAGLTEETIVAFIRSRNSNYDLSAENVIALREQGFSPAMLNAMLESGKVAIMAPPAPEQVSQPQTAPQPAPQVVVQPAIVAQPAFDQDVAYFYQELSPYGRWILSEENQWYWQPGEVASSPGWRPYWDQGHWVYTDHGWYWASDYPWGWAAFHYGRWNLHPHHGWIWYPDREWAPAWVTWRIGGDYCGWAPLPRYSHYDYVGGGLSFHGRHVEADFSFGLAWSQFNFSYLREMGERPRPRFRTEVEARRIFSQTTVINNYSVSKTIVNNETHPRIINRGIDPGRVAAVKGKPIQQVQIQDRRTPSPSRSPERVDVRTKTLEVYRPRFTEPSKPQRGLPVAAPIARPSAPPPNSERGKLPPGTPRTSPGAPSPGSRSLPTNPKEDRK